MVQDIPIVDYLHEQGIETRKEGHYVFCSSPFSSDRNWSFCIYPTNTYFDWSTGHGGNIVDLHSRVRGIGNKEAYKELIQGIEYEKYKPNYKQFKTEGISVYEFQVERYINKVPEEVEAITRYAQGRGITEGYHAGVFFTRAKGQSYKWIRNPSLMFIHTTPEGNPCGAKFRKIVQQTPEDQSPRFSARGRSSTYLLKPTLTSDLRRSNVLYVVEGEANANSLWMYLKKTCPVVSCGGVTQSPTRSLLPENLRNSSIRLLIDHDGNEKLYNERLKLYEELNAEPIKLILPKGEDINSLYCGGRVYLIDHLL